jgi:hypothetical protein
MKLRPRAFKSAQALAAFVMCVALARPVLAQDISSLQNLRSQYDVMMANFERALAAQGDKQGQAQARRGREAMRTLTDAQLARLYSRTRVPNLSVAVIASEFLVSRAEARQAAATDAARAESRPTAAGDLASAASRPTAAADLPPLTLSPPFPGPVDVPSGCNGVNIDAAERYALLIIKEVANAVLAAAAWVCNEDILGENGSLACVPLAIAADIANGFFDTATFCAGEVTANQVDANFNRLSHIHDDLAEALNTIVNTSNANTLSIITNDNTNKTTIINNDNANTTTIVNNDNANLATSIANANANKNELRDLILRTQIEADLAMADSAVVVALFALPTASGGYLDLVMTIVTETLAHTLAAGGSISNAQSFLNDANAAKAAGDFKGAYALYRKAYKAAGK